MNGDKGDLGIGNFDRLALTLVQHPDLDVERDRGSPNALDIRVAADRVAADRVAADRVADMHRLQKRDVRDGNVPHIAVRTWGAGDARCSGKKTRAGHRS